MLVVAPKMPRIGVKKSARGDHKPARTPPPPPFGYHCSQNAWGANASGGGWCNARGFQGGDKEVSHKKMRPETNPARPFHILRPWAADVRRVGAGWV